MHGPVSRLVDAGNDGDEDDLFGVRAAAPEQQQVPFPSHFAAPAGMPVIVDRGISRASLGKRARTCGFRSHRAENDRDGQDRQDALANETKVTTPGG